MPILIALTAIVQALFIFHVFRTGRPYWWGFIILSAPLIGSAAYYFMEVFPGSREQRSVRRMAGNAARAVKPDAVLQQRLAAVDNCPSIANKAAAAEEYMRCGLHHEAADLYQGTLNGSYAQDPHLLFGLARAQIGDGAFDNALSTLQQLKAANTKYRPEEVRLVEARALEGLGKTEEALTVYEELAPVYVGLEARCRYALLLKDLGFVMQADTVFTEMLLHAKRFKLNPGTEQQWIDTARRQMGELMPA